MHVCNVSIYGEGGPMEGNPIPGNGVGSICLLWCTLKRKNNFY